MKLTNFVKKMAAPLLVLGLFAMLSACNNAASSSGGNNGTGGNSEEPVITWDLEMGEFPQTRKAANVSVDTNTLKEVGDFTYYMGSDGAWYAKLDSNYYKVEPIKWRILDENYLNMGHKLVVSDKILTNIAFFDGQRDTDGAPTANDYMNSRINAYLNGLAYIYLSTIEDGLRINDEFAPMDWEDLSNKLPQKGFLYTAFDEETREEINNARTLITEDEDYKDMIIKVFLLSDEDVSAYNLLEEENRFDTTDYANDNNGHNKHWWTRTPSPLTGQTDTHIEYVHQGKESQYMYVSWSDVGVLPAMLID